MQMLQCLMSLDGWLVGWFVGWLWQMHCGEMAGLVSAGVDLGQC